MRAVLDPNVLIAAVLSHSGPPARILARWRLGHLELVVSPLLLDELSRALGYPKLRKRIPAAEADAYRELLERGAVFVGDPPGGPYRSPDREDDYLLALAASARAILVSGDRHLLGLAHALPILTARQFLETLDSDA